MKRKFVAMTLAAMMTMSLVGCGDTASSSTDNGKTYIIRELASQEMKNSAGATWDAATAGNAIGIWSSSFGDQIDVIASNNDGMGMSMFNAWSKDNNVPTFGYDANSDAVAAIALVTGEGMDEIAFENEKYVYIPYKTVGE